MAHESQDQAWHRWLDRTDDELGHLTDEGRRFVAVLREQLAAAGGERSSGDRQRVTSALRTSLITVLTERGLELDGRPASVELAPGIAKTADVSFTAGEVRWVVEIKCGLEFNSLGAAVLEGVLFRYREPEARLVLLSLYSKMRLEPEHLNGLLEELGVGHAFDLISVLSLNTDSDDVWWTNMATRINNLLDQLPT